MEHTKGEWKVSSCKRRVYNNISDDPCRNFTIADCANTGIPQKEVEANAKLISASKDMLEALIELEKLTFSLNVKVDALTALALTSCRERVINAINKATK